MKAKAARLRLQADEIFVWADRIDAKVDGMRFEGRAATRLHSTMQTWKTDVKRAGTELQDLAQLLLRSAGDVETRQAAEARRLAEQKGHK
ncbi:MAG: hypothetical protein WBQ14_00525 [Gaiellaceae bacterium]